MSEIGESIGFGDLLGTNGSTSFTFDILAGNSAISLSGIAVTATANTRSGNSLA